MNTPKLPPLPEPTWPFGCRYNEKDMQAYAIAAIEAQGVPDGLRSALQRIADWKSHDLQLAVDRGFNGVRDFYRQIAIDALASAPPAPQAAPQPLSDEQVEDFRAAACKETYITRDDYHRAFHDGWRAAHGIKEQT